MQAARGRFAIAIAGPGKIARDQHLPAIAGDGDFQLVASVGGALPGVPGFDSIDSLRRSGPRVDAVAICTPPQVRAKLALEALAAGWHVMLEKPPAASVAECGLLRAAAAARNLSLLAAWHSRFAAQVEPARRWLAGRRIARGAIVWREDAQQWHPGQDWLWQPGGMGVFDPGINALSILTRIAPVAVELLGAAFEVPERCSNPIAARLLLRAGGDITADFDFRHTGAPSWDISIETADGGAMMLRDGGAGLSIDGVALPAEANAEYPRLYRHFARLICSGRSDFDVMPLELVEQAFGRARGEMANSS